MDAELLVLDLLHRALDLHWGADSVAVRRR